jgi:copper chaperone CopZ
LKVKGLTAENAAAVEQALKRVKGVANAKANPADGTVTVDLVVPKPEDAEKPDVSLDRLIGAVEGATGLSVEG